MIDVDGPRAQDTIKQLTHHLSRHAKSRLSYRTTATPVIDDRQDPKWSPVGQDIMDEIHAPACGTVIHLNDTNDGRVCDSPTSPLAAATPRSADSQTAVGHGPYPACGARGPIDPWRDLFDTTRLDQTALRDRPARSSPETSRETTRPAHGGGRAVDFFRKASDSMSLSSERSTTSRFNRLFSSSTCRSRRSSLMPRCAYFFFHV